MTQFLRPKAVAKRYGTTISTIYRWANEDRYASLNFPKFITFGPNTSALDEAALDRFDAERIAKRDEGEAGKRIAVRVEGKDDEDSERPP